MVRSWGSRIRQMKNKGKTQLVTIPKEVVSDPSYPFKPGDRVWIRIAEEEKNVLRIERANGDE